MSVAGIGRASRPTTNVGRITPRWRWLLSATAALLALVAGACGATSNDRTAETVDLLPVGQTATATLDERIDTDGDGETSDEEIEAYARGVLLDFSQCMRDNGYPEFTDVVLEDFTEGGGGQAQFLALMNERGVSLADPNAIPTLQTCGEGLADLQTFAPQPSDDELAETEALVLEFAACMRRTGIDDWPDPDFANNPDSNGYGPELLAAFDFQSTEIQEAIASCQAENSGVAIGPDDTEGAEDADVGEEGPPADTTPAPPRAVSPVIEGATADLNVAVVTRRDLVQTTTLDGSLGYGDERPFPTNTTGIVTALPDEGTIIEFGEPLFYVDNEPVLLFEGTIPQYRPFTASMTDGPDIEQLERSLTAFGYADDYDLTVDDDFTRVTRDVVEQLQMDFGIEDTGRLDLGRVVFSPTAVRVSGVNVELGQTISPQVVVLSVTENDQRITLDLDADDRSLIDVGTGVRIELPDGTDAAGVVSDIADVATRSINPQTGAAADPSIDVTIRFAGDPPADVFDAAPVDVVVVEQVSEAVLTVPVPALVALSSGGHAVELIVDGGTQLIPVELGDFVDDIVEVSGDVQEGDRVVMAAG